MMGLLLIISSPDVNIAKDTIIEKNMSFWAYSSCIASSGVEVMAFYLSSDLSGGIPVLLGVGAGAAGCTVYSYTAYALTPVRELKPKAFNTAFKGGAMGIFIGIGVVVILKGFRII